MMRLAILTWLVLGGEAVVAAGPCPPTYPVYPPTAVAAVAVVRAVFVPHPSYTVGLAYPDPRLDEVLDRLDQLRPVEPPPPPATSAAAASCLRCHTGAAAKGNLRLDGPLSPEIRAAAVDQVLTRKMPPDQRLTDDQVRAAVLEIVRAK